MARMAVLDAITQLDTARRQTLALVAGLSDEQVERVHSPLLSPLAWDLGHIAAFEDLWLAHRHGGLPLLHAELADVYDAVETPRAHRGELPFLRRADAEEYMCAVRDRVRELEYGPLHELVARHEYQHAETMLQTLNIARLTLDLPASERPAAPPPSSGVELVDVGGGTFPLGAGTEGFAYDNERPQHLIEVGSFRIGRTAVTNGDWLEFIDDGGYSRREWWSEAGWAWRRAEQVERPLNWLPGSQTWTLGGGAGTLDPARPVAHVSWFEADAFVRSHGLRLPSEAEWEFAATWAGDAKLAWPWGSESPDPQRANLIESGWLEPAPAGSLPAGGAPCGALGMIGDVWEWTSTEFDGYPGFVAHPYPEYSEVFFGSGYRVLRGGSFAASGQVATPTFRNWDHPQRRQIFAGLRVAAEA